MERADVKNRQVSRKSAIRKWSRRNILLISVGVLSILCTTAKLGSLTRLTHEFFGNSLKICSNLQLEKGSNDAEHGWYDTAESIASQGKLWHPRIVRRLPSHRRQFLRHKSSKGQSRDTTPGTCTKWAVVTTIFAPTKVIFQLSNLVDWCLVVIGDLKTNDETWKSFSSKLMNKVVYISSKDQVELPYKSIDIIPWNHFGRKNIGYMFAIHHGARVIWDTDDDNKLRDPELLNALESEAEDVQVVPEVSNIHHLWNPYPHFRSVNYTSMLCNSTNSRPYIWPRGFPLPSIKDPETIRTGLLGSSMSASVFQSLADNDPDVDAIFRLSQPLPIFFSRRETRSTIEKIVLPEGRMAPFNAQATLWTLPSFWGLLLPITVHGRVSDIWRSYIAQRLFHIVGQRLAFTSPIAVQIRNVHSYIADLQAEIPLYTQTHELVMWMSNWHPPPNSTFVSAVEDLYVNLYEIGVLEISDIELLQKWISDLSAMGYTFPELVIQ